MKRPSRPTDDQHLLHGNRVARRERLFERFVEQALAFKTRFAHRFVVVASHMTRTAKRQAIAGRAEVVADANCSRVSATNASSRNNFSCDPARPWLSKKQQNHLRRLPVPDARMVAFGKQPIIYFKGWIESIETDVRPRWPVFTRIPPRRVNTTSISTPASKDVSHDPE